MIISVTRCFKQIRTTVELAKIVTRDDYEIITVPYVLPLILCSSDLILHLGGVHIYLNCEWHHVRSVYAKVLINFNYSRFVYILC